MTAIQAGQEWDDVLDFWFPEGRSSNVDAQAQRTHWHWRMQGGADDEIVARFSDLTGRAAQGGLDPWVLEPYGRQALMKENSRPTPNIGALAIDSSVRFL